MVLTLEEIRAKWHQEYLDGNNDGYTFEEFLLFWLDLLDYECKAQANKEKYENWVLAGGERHRRLNRNGKLVKRTKKENDKLRRKYGGI
jgi:hypothetical protein|tara:strand:- start:2765 stop:3031 length:267 start_codon:yes stop_codon:yes gene_type:complete